MILNGTDLAEFNFTPGQHLSSNVALEGMYDLPARDGVCFYSWAEADSVEAYADQEEIYFKGRDLRLVGYITGPNRATIEGKNRALIDLVKSFTGLVPFSSEFGVFQVLVKSIQSSYIGEPGLELTITLREPVVSISNLVPAPDAAQFGIDSISFNKLGGVLLLASGDVRNLTVAKQQFFTSYRKEGYQITKREAPKFELQLAIITADLLTFKAKIDGLMALFSAPGSRLLNMPNDMLREFFVTDGFTVKNLTIESNRVFGLVTIKAIELFDLERRIGYLKTNDGIYYITDNYYNKILGRL